MDVNISLSEHIPLAGIYTSVVILVCVITITLFGNVILLFAIVSDKKLRRPLYILLSNFLMADILFVSVAIPLNIATLIADRPPFGSIICHLQGYVTFGTLSTTACILTVIALYRLIQVCYSNLWVKITELGWLLGAILLSWVLPVVICAAFGGGVAFQKVKLTCTFIDITSTYVLVALLYIPMTVSVVICYIKIYIFTRKSRKRVAAISVVSETAEKIPRPYKRKDDVVFRMMMLVFVEFLAFYVGPGTLNSFLGVVSVETSYYISLVAFLLFRMRPAANVITYMITNQELRNGFIACVKCVHKSQRDKLPTTQNSQL